MQEIIKRGKTPDKVIKSFKEEHNLEDSELNYTVEHKGSKGFLALFGKKDAIVKFKLPEIEDTIKKFLTTLFKHINVNYKDIVIEQDKHIYRILIKGVNNPGFLIGKDGKMLTSIQYLLNKVIDDRERRKVNVVLNVDSNRNNRQANGKKMKDRPFKYRNTPDKRKGRNTYPGRARTK